MFDLARFFSSSFAKRDAERDAAPLAPARALLTPTWIGALALLVANDHWLKGSGLMPGLLTGKLSDFAGMIVAPVLLATLLQVRSRRALLACHLAVGAVFAGIQLSPAFAGQWSALMAALGHPWAITCDPTDLLALPFLGLAWALLVPEMDSSRPALIPLQRTAVAGLSVFGLWSTVATSQVDGDIDFDDVWYEDVYGNLYINNANDHDIALFVRPLRADVTIDCLQVSLDPGRMLRPELFSDAEHWLLPPRTNVALGLGGGVIGCSAVWIAGEGIDPTIVFVDDVGDYPQTWFNGQHGEPEALGDAGMAIVFDETGSEWIGGEALRFVPRQDAPEQPEGCEAPAGESRLDWSPIAGQVAELISIEAGIDGCYELELRTMIATGQFDEPYLWYLCAPEAAVPFEPGELLELTTNAGNQGSSELSVMLLDPETLAPALDEQNRVIRHARYLRGGTDPALISPALDRELVAIPGVSCPWQVEDGCGTVERSVELAVEGSQSFLVPGEPVTFGTGNFVHTAIATYARERAVIDPLCSSGALALSYDIDFVVIDEPLL